MSGREHEPVAAFFPSIDRNLIRDLDRHLRNAKPALEPSVAPKLPPAPSLPPAPPHEAFVAPPMVSPQPDQPVVAPLPKPLDRTMPRPNIAGVLEAVENAAHSLAAMTSRIEDLEAQIEAQAEAAEAAGRHYETQLNEADQAHRDLDAKLTATVERAERSEALAAQQGARVVDLERELATVHADLARVTEAITAALGLPHDHSFPG